MTETQKAAITDMLTIVQYRAVMAQTALRLNDLNGCGRHLHCAGQALEDASRELARAGFAAAADGQTS